jgi:hypothetical protein
VAILMPRSSQMWDAADIEIPTVIRDATNTDLNRATVDYMAEVFDLYLALQHANIPTEFISEDELNAADLARWQVIYATAPDVPREGLLALLAWAHGGGTLVTVPGALTHDRYHQPLDLYPLATRHERLLIDHVNQLDAGPALEFEDGDLPTFGPMTELSMEEHPVGAGRLLHFGFFPGLTYYRSGDERADKLPVGFSDTLREIIIAPVREAGIVPPVTVSVPLVETPVLVSPRGATVTLLNWTGAPIDDLAVTLRLPLPVGSIESLRHGVLTVADAADSQTGAPAVTVSLPLDAADILLVRPLAPAGESR